MTAPDFCVSADSAYIGKDTQFFPPLVSAQKEYHDAAFLSILQAYNAGLQHGLSRKQNTRFTGKVG